MKNVLARLITLQDLQLKRGRKTAATTEEIRRLRAGIPEPVLAHFDRMLARGKTGVAIANNGVCGGCHLRISSGTWGNLRDTNRIHLCDSCGRYLYLCTESETPPPKVSEKAKKRATKEDLGLAA